MSHRDTQNVAEQIASLARFPDENPNPVMRIGFDATLIYANPASGPLLDQLGGSVGEPAPNRLWDPTAHAIDAQALSRFDVSVNGRIFSFGVQPLPGPDYCNLYGADVTESREAEKHVQDLARFPDENPNPVMRFSTDGRVIYANRPSDALLRLWGIATGDVLPENVAYVLGDAIGANALRTLEVECGETIFLLALAPVLDSGYLNVYGRDVTTEKLANQRLVEARDRALAASRAKSAFLANMSHELRTPMNAIIGYSEMLIEDAEDFGAEEMKPDLEKIHGAGKHLLALINDILDLSKIEAGRMDLYLEEFDANGLIDEVAATVMPLATTNDCEFIVRTESEVGLITSDMTKLRQNLFNLLSNAFKFTSKGTVTLHTSIVADDAGHKSIRFAVSDTGIGMSQDQISKIFLSFMQGDDSTTREYGGTGLGLTITKRFCEMLGGGITVQSDVGKGTTFVMTVPTRSRKAMDRARMTGTDPLLRDTAERVMRTTGTASAPVLVVDDDATVRDILSATLKRAGYAVITAEDGPSGLAMAIKWKPAAITLDVFMPGMDGWETLSRLKSDPRTQDIPVIVCTMYDDRNLGFALGASEFMTKPVDRKRLLKLLARYRSKRDNPTVLVVDDEPDVRDVICRSLAKEGWKSVEAENGRIALEQLEACAPQLVLLDLMMPVMDGFQFLQEVRKHEKFATLPVVVVTARELSKDEREFLAGNTREVLQKGAYSRTELMQKVCELVGQSVKSDTPSEL